MLALRVNVYVTTYAVIGFRPLTVGIFPVYHKLRCALTLLQIGIIGCCDLHKRQVYTQFSSKNCTSQSRNRKCSTKTRHGRCAWRICSTSVYFAFQMFSGAFSIVYVFARILWFAHLQGMKLKENDKKVSVTVNYA